MIDNEYIHHLQKFPFASLLSLPFTSPHPTQPIKKFPATADKFAFSKIL